MMDPEQKPSISELKITIISTLSEVKKEEKKVKLCWKLCVIIERTFHQTRHYRKYTQHYLEFSGSVIIAQPYDDSKKEVAGGKYFQPTLSHGLAQQAY